MTGHCDNTQEALSHCIVILVFLVIICWLAKLVFPLVNFSETLLFLHLALQHALSPPPNSLNQTRSPLVMSQPMTQNGNMVPSRGSTPINRAQVVYSSIMSSFNHFCEIQFNATTVEIDIRRSCCKQLIQENCFLLVFESYWYWCIKTNKQFSTNKKLKKIKKYSPVEL